MTAVTDRRFRRIAGGVAHDSLQGQVEGVRFTPGRWHRLARPLSDLRTEPGGALDRQLPLGTRFCALTQAGGSVYGFAEPDGYCGWLPAAALGPDGPVTHWLAAPASHLYPEPRVRAPARAALPHGAHLAVTATRDGFAETSAGFVPLPHLRPQGDWLADPVAVARGFLGVPYLWGGNSAAGIDCSGLVQAALRACGRPCPADSDLQCAMPGADVAPGDERPGDLVFWRGHVAMVSAPGLIVHANAHHMAVAEEPLAAAESRIAARGDPVLRRLRPAG